MPKKEVITACLSRVDVWVSTVACTAPMCANCRVIGCAPRLQLERKLPSPDNDEKAVHFVVQVLND
jgi:hypothetical protein